MKRDIVDKLYSIAIRRYREEHPDRELTNAFMTTIWYSIKGLLDEMGEDVAVNYVKTAKLW